MDFTTNFSTTFRDAVEFLSTLLAINGTVIVYYWFLIIGDRFSGADSRNSQIKETRIFFREVLCPAWTFYALELLLYVSFYRVALFLGW